MNPTKSEKKRIIKALQAARPYIESGQADYVCAAISLAFIKRRIKTAERKWGKDYVMSLIHPYVSVDRWLVSKNFFTPLLPTWTDYRLAWIDHMIKELQK